jgi:hypothetical protein
MKNTISRLALIEAASFFGGVHHKRYSVEQDKWSLKHENYLLLKKIIPNKSLIIKGFQRFLTFVYTTIRKYYDKFISLLEKPPYICLTVLNNLILN